MKSLIFFLVFSSKSLAIPISYDESIDGDLSVSSFIYYGEAFTFSSGTNKVAGQITIGRDTADFDPFFFIVPEDMLLASITYSFSIYERNYISSAGASYTLRNGIDNSYLGSSGRVDVINTSDPILLFEDSLPYSSDFTDLLPLGPDTYLFGHTLLASSHAGLPYLATWDYEIYFELTSVNSVPEPPIIAIFLFGLFSIFAAKYSANKSFKKDAKKHCAF